MWARCRLSGEDDWHIGCMRYLVGHECKNMMQTDRQTFRSYLVRESRLLHETFSSSPSSRLSVSPCWESMMRRKRVQREVKEMPAAIIYARWGWVQWRCVLSSRRGRVGWRTLAPNGWLGLVKLVRLTMPCFLLLVEEMSTSLGTDSSSQSLFWTKTELRLKGNKNSLSFCSFSTHYFSERWDDWLFAGEWRSTEL